MRLGMIGMVIVLLCGIAYGDLQADEPVQLNVDVAPMSPCVMVSEDGEYYGFDIDVWEEMARRAGLSYHYRQVNFSEIFTGLKSGTTDAALGGITINEQRERDIDFSHSYLKSGLRIISPGSLGKVSVVSAVTSVLSLVFSWQMGLLIVILVVTMSILGIMLRVIEMWGEPNPNIRPGFMGLIDACWCVWAQMTTMGFGDIVPRRTLGRMLSMPSYISGTVILGTILAIINAQVILDAISTYKSVVQTPRDLIGKRVATVEGSTSVDFLKFYDAKILPTANEASAFQKLVDGEVDAVVFDSPAAMYFMSKYTDNRPLVMLEKLFDIQYYGFALQQGSPHREQLNLALLGMFKDGSYDRIHEKWFGSNE